MLSATAFGSTHPDYPPNAESWAVPAGRDTREKPFACHCGQAFTRRDLLRRHERISHADSQVSSNPAASEREAESHEHFDPARPGNSSQTQPGDASYISLQSSPARAPSVNVTSNPPDIDNWSALQPETNFNSSRISQSTRIPAPAGDVMSRQQQPSQLMFPPEYQEIPSQLSYFPVEFNHFEDFTNFLDGIGLPAEWTPLAEDQWDEPNPAGTKDADETPTSRDRHISSREEDARPDTPFRSWLPSAPPGDQSLDTIEYCGPHGARASLSPYRITEKQRNCLVDSLESFGHLLPRFKVPSRYTLTRYLTSYFEGFHSHLPFIHVPTLRVNDHTPELILALATVGAQYRFEYANAEKLFHSAKAIVLERIRREEHSYDAGMESDIASSGAQHPPSYYSHQPRQNTPDDLSSRNSGRAQTDIIRTLLALMGYATWEHKHMLHEAFSLQGLLVRRLRETGLRDDPQEDLAEPISWQHWAEDESERRTKLIAFSFLHMHSVAYNIYPVLRSSEIHLRLPSSTKEWTASNPTQWNAARRATPARQLFFQDALSRLLRKSESTVAVEPIPTPLGNYLLLHGLLQRIHLVRELSLPIFDQSAALPTDELNKLERALRSWTSIWQQAPESSLDPQNENGPIPFTSSALLGLAYVRTCLNLGPYRRLETRDPVCIAAALHKSPSLERSYRLIPALLYAAHALSIPVRIGVDYVARSQAFFWSVRHSLASLECAVLLKNEARILHWVRCIVSEARESMDAESDTDPNLESDHESNIDGNRHTASRTQDQQASNPRFVERVSTRQPSDASHYASQQNAVHTIPGDNSTGSASAANPATGIQSNENALHRSHHPPPSVCNDLSLAVVKIWARFFKNNVQWPFINVMGESLELYARGLEEEFK
ncbi:hypothetical protein BP5796_03577 [Coleophoma crateriformis]|uniref:C2H2-type domain-containing protein n=1 Tax=Coleophoma crateriformis TaxID=565419 RepID=A0A3D8SNH6_9HELO|nr:hypothetical protein BP5796_03577 [Coleophoma crateriformis]